MASSLQYILDEYPSFSDSPFSFTATTAAILLVLYVIKQQIIGLKYDYYLRNVPNAPGWVPFFGHIFQLMDVAPWDKMLEWIVKNNFGILRCQFLNYRALVISHPKHISQVFNKNQRNYPKDIELSYKSFMDILGHGIITSDGEYWRKQRTLLSHAFRVSILEDTMLVAKKAGDRLSRKLETYRGTGKPIEMAEEFRLMTLEVIGELLMSLTPEVSNQIFPSLYLPLVTEANLRVWEPWRKYMPTSNWFKYRETLSKLDTYMIDTITNRWEERQARIAQGLPATQPVKEGSCVDVLDQVLDNLDPDTWGPATIDQLKDEFKSFVLAGHETSASMLMWTLYELTQNPDILERMKKEGYSVFGECRRTPTVEGEDEFSSVPLPGAEELRNLNLTVNVLKEAIRKYTLVPVVSRYALKDDVLDGVPVPAGTKIFVNIKAAHNNPEFWAEPSKFNPDRFDEKYDPYAYLPFINGPRNCLGQYLALLE
eukprot:Ihof_evm2s530 gene=Ihof_evmTU2s530